MPELLSWPGAIQHALRRILASMLFKTVALIYPLISIANIEADILIFYAKISSMHDPCKRRIVH